ncbi:hypothetical protein TrRE_jg4975, partial [Triparma retinervis]
MFSASNANQDDGDDPYGFDVDFSSKKFKPSYAQSSFDDEDDIVFSDSEDEDPAEKFRKNKSTKGKKSQSGTSKPSGVKKSSTSGSALDRASAYLSKYKGGGQDKDKAKAKKKSPVKSPGDDFSAFMDDSDSDGGGGGGRGLRSGGKKKASPKASPSPTTKRERRPNVESMLQLDKSSSSVNMTSPRQGSSSPSLGNTMKSKFSSPTIGVLKSGSDIKDIYRPPSPLYNPTTPMSAGNRSNVSESLEESIASFTDDIPSRDEAMGKVMDFASLNRIAVGGEDGGLEVE